METVWRFLKKLRIELPYDPAIPLPGIYSKEMKTGFQKGICTSTLTAALFITAKTGKNPKCPSPDKWIKKWYIYTTEYYSAMRKKVILLFVTGQTLDRP